LGAITNMSKDQIQDLLNVRLSIYTEDNVSVDIETKR